MFSRSLNLSLFLKIGVALLFSVGNAYATPEIEAELKKIDEIQAQLNLKKDWAQYRFDQASVECYQKFFTSSCIKDARKIYRQETLAIRSQELPMNDRQRQLKELLKTERDNQRRLEREDPKRALERAENKKAYEEKQAKMIERTQELEERRKDAPKRSEGNRNASPF